MKGLFFLLCAFFLFINSGKASHLQGGEVSWECISSGTSRGKFIFNVRLYRECRGAGLPNSISISNPLYSKYGGVSTINCVKQSDNVVTNICSDTNLNVCGQSSSLGLVIEERKYKSAPAFIKGEPDSNGSKFAISLCCRPFYLDNIYASGSYYIAATMYPFIDPATKTAKSLGSSTASCYDSSPQFAEAPNVLVSGNRSSVFSETCIDSDQDVLIYKWGKAMKNSSTPQAYRTGYSDKLQFPNTNHSTLNSDPTIDSSTGQITTNFYTGVSNQFNLCVEVSSYRCGQLIAQVKRDYTAFAWNATNNNSYTYDSTYNTAPNISFKFPNGSVKRGSFVDTIYLGDTIRFEVLVSDSQLLDSNLYQSVELMANSSQLSSPGNYSFKNCPYPPCASIDQTIPSWNGSGWKDTVMVNTDFYWAPNCGLLNADGCGFSNIKSFFFNFYAKDNFCKYPAQNMASVEIVVIDSAVKEINIDTIIDHGDSITIKFNPYTGTNFNAYYIRHSNDKNASFLLIDSITNRSTNYYRYTKSSSDSSANYFYITLDTNLPCQGYDLKGCIAIELNSLANGLVQLNWKRPIINVLNPGSFSYILYKIDSNGIYNSIDTTNLNSYTDTVMFCGYNKYYIEYSSSSFYSKSIIDSIDISYFDQISLIQSPDTLSVDSIYIPYKIEWYINNNLLTNFTSDSIPIDSVGRYHAKLIFPGGCEIETKKIQHFTIDEISVNSVGSTYISWTPYLNNLSNYNSNAVSEVMSARNPNGPYQRLGFGSASNNFITSSGYGDTASAYFYIVYDTLNRNIRSTVKRSIHLVVQNQNDSLPRCDWNSPHLSTNPDLSNYIIKSRLNLWSYSVIGSTLDTSFYDIYATCNNTTFYLVQIKDSLGFSATSNTANIVVDSVVYVALDRKLDSIFPKHTLNFPRLNTWFKDSVQLQDTTSYFLIDSFGNYSIRVDYSNGCVLLSDTINCDPFSALPFINQVTVDSVKNVILDWTSVSYLGSDFSSYNIYVATDSLGPYNILDSIKDIDSTSYYDSKSIQPNVYYYLITIEGYTSCVNDTIESDISNIVGTNGISINNLNYGTLGINWTPFFATRAKSAQNMYIISRKYGSSSWILIDSTIYGQESLNDTVIGCLYPIKYKIEIDSIGVMSTIYGSIKIDSFQVKADWVNDSILITIAGLTHKWYKDGNLIPGAGFNSFVPTEPGFYYAVTELDNGCIAVSDEIDLMALSSNAVGDMENTEIFIFPNPSKGTFTIDFQKTFTGNIIILNPLGKKILERRIESKNTYEVLLDKSVSEGIYIVKLFNSKSIFTKKILIQKE